MLILDCGIQRLADLTFGILLIIDDHILLLQKVDLEPFDFSLQPFSFLLLVC